MPVYKTLKFMKICKISEAVSGNLIFFYLLAQTLEHFNL